MPQWFIKFLIKRLWGGAVKNEIVENKELAEELHKAFIRKFKKRKVHSSIINNIWRADLADMKFDFCCVLLIFIVNIFGLFLRKIRKVLQLLILSKKYQMNLIANQAKYEYIKTVNFTIDQ